MNKRLISWGIWVLVLLALLIAVSLFSISMGSADISIKKVIASFFDNTLTKERSIIFDIRIPRVILGIVIGGALSIAGVLLQAMFRNPLVEPYTLGVSGGAALGVCLNIVLKLDRLFIISLPISGFLGAVLVILLTHYLSTRRGTLNIQGLLLTGVMISFITSSMVMLVMAVSRTEDIHGIVFWIMGSLEEPKRILINLVAIVSLLGLFVSYLFCMDLNALSLGEEEALHLGINIEKLKKILFFLASMLTGFSVSVAGVIGFVGLVIPHFVRLFVGADHRIVLISSYLVGGAFLVLCDTVARVIISPLELPVGVITGIVGGTIFVYALGRQRS